MRKILAIAGAAVLAGLLTGAASPSPGPSSQAEPVIVQANGNPDQPAPPGASATTMLPGPVTGSPLLANGYYSVVAFFFDGNSLAFSIPSNLWYDAATNVTNVKTGGGGTWQEIHNANSPGYCWTEDFANGGSTNIIQDKSPCASLASQLFQLIDGGGNPAAWHIQNLYMNQKQSHICGAAHGDQPTVLTTPGANQPVFMGCPENAPYLTDNQIWDMQPSS